MNEAEALFLTPDSLAAMSYIHFVLDVFKSNIKILICLNDPSSWMKSTSTYSETIHNLTFAYMLMGETFQ